MKKSLLIGCSALLAIGVYSCGSGGGGGSGSSGGSSASPNPYPQSGSYNGIPYSSLPQPSSVAGSALDLAFPSAYLPNRLTNNSLQIAYGYTAESTLANLTAYVTISINSDQNYICSATPVKYDPASNTTFLISAAHCFLRGKPNADTVENSDLYYTRKITVYQGTDNLNFESWFNPVKAVYIPQDYCYGDTFSMDGDEDCSNFSPNNEAVIGGEGNDIAVIQIEGKFGNPESYPYPEVVPASEYPQTYTMAPVLSLGYGINSESPNTRAKCSNSTEPCGTMFYVANYQYAVSDDRGYHYLYNSYYNNDSLGTGYTALICGGDSGGGDLFWTGSKWILLSEHTYGPAGVCGTFYNYLPNASTNVSAYYEWIQSIFADPVNAAKKCSDGTIANCVTNGLL